jgi:hypothetical protein
MRRLALPVAAVGAVLGLGLGGTVADTISIGARPLIAGAGDRVVVSGAHSSGRADVDVTLEAQYCDETTWREVSATHTDPGGAWYLEYVPLITQVIRAKGGGATSAEIKVQTRPTVSLGQRPPGMFFVNVNSQRSFWRKSVSIQRFDRQKRVWREVRKVQLTETGAPPGVGWVWTGSEKVRVKVPKGTTLRAVLPLSQTRPCYLAGYSNLLRR